MGSGGTDYGDRVDYFVLFGFTPGLLIDPEELRSRYSERLRQLDPEVMEEDTPEELEMRGGMRQRVQEAWRALRDLGSRAAALTHLYGVDEAPPHAEDISRALQQQVITLGRPAADGLRVEDPEIARVRDALAAARREVLAKLQSLGHAWEQLPKVPSVSEPLDIMTFALLGNMRAEVDKLVLLDALDADVQALRY